MLNPRKPPRSLQLGNVQIGGNAAISIQSMLNVKTSDVSGASAQIKRLVSAGCEIVRFSVMDSADAAAIALLKREFPEVPLVADIHFDYKLALAAIAGGIDGLRINPGNIGSRAGVESLVAAAKERKVPSASGK
jgi:(E)-4-hydroxy-3-methylbut-2-enyl-diphosphate synthase